MKISLSRYQKSKRTKKDTFGSFFASNKGTRYHYIINPLQGVMYLPNGSVGGSAPESGEFSLSHRFDMGYPKYAEYALFKNVPFFKEVVGVDPDLEYETDIVCVQKWKYDPLVFSRNGQVDPVSLICTFADTREERIHKCLDQIREEIWSWQKIQN